MRTRGVLVALVALFAMAAGLAFGQHTRAAGLLVLAAEIEGWPRTLARLHERPVAQRLTEIPTREGVHRARVFSPDGRIRRTAVLVSGVHPAGIDDPRLIHFARSMAAVGLGVVTPEVPGLFQFEITPGATDIIEDVAAWAAAQEDLSPDGRAGLVGISFSGGLAIVAAGRPRLHDVVAFVLSVGGHGDLVRTLDVLGGGILTDEQATADAFGLVMVLASVAEQVVPAGQVAPLRDWARTYLEGAHLPFGDPARAALSARAEQLRASLPDPAARFAERALTKDVAALRPYLLHHVRTLAADPALSPERAPPPRAPVYLLHGVDDPVIPPDESLHLAAHLRVTTPVRVLLTPILGHADVEPGLAPGDALDVIVFVASLLRQ